MNKSFDWFCEPHAQMRKILMVCQTMHINKMLSCLFGRLPLHVQVSATFLFNKQLPLTCTCLHVSVQALSDETKSEQASNSFFKDMEKRSIIQQKKCINATCSTYLFIRI